MAEYSFEATNINWKRQDFQREVMKRKRRVAENDPTFINEVSL